MMKCPSCNEVVVQDLSTSVYCPHCHNRLTPRQDDVPASGAEKTTVSSASKVQKAQRYRCPSCNEVVVVVQDLSTSVYCPHCDYRHTPRQDDVPASGAAKTTVSSASKVQKAQEYRCPSCNEVVEQDLSTSVYCPHCHNRLTPRQDDVPASGAAKTTVSSQGYIAPSSTQSAQREQEAHDKRHGLVLSSGVSVAALLFLGGIAICIGVYLTRFMMIAGHHVADTSNNDFIVMGGAIWAVFAPCLPYILLGCVVAVIARISNKQAILPLIFTAVILCTFTCIFHVCSGMIKELGQQFDSKGLINTPTGFAIFYCVVGMVAGFVILVKFGESTGN